MSGAYLGCPPVWRRDPARFPRTDRGGFV